MRYLLTVLLILTTFLINAQNRFPSIDSAKNYVTRYVKNSAVETFTNWRAQNVAFGTLELLDSLAGDGASVPTLQQVTTAGNTTSDNIIFSGGLGEYGKIEYVSAGPTGGRVAYFTAKTNFTNQYIKYGATGLSHNVYNSASERFVSLPDSSGTLTQRVTINGTTYNTAANGVVDLGTISSDTATVVKAYVTNAEAVTITKGQVVYIFGAQGDRASVKLAKNTSDTFSSKTLGIVRANIAAGQAGWITTQGQVSGINLSAYSPGDILWLDSVAGGFTNIKPVAPKHSVFVGVVERANAGNGLIYVKPQNGVELDELHNVKITSETNNQVLAYTASTGIWENKTIDSSYFNNQFATQVRAAQNNTVGGVAWTGADSSLASNWAVNGFHEQDEPLFRTSSSVTPGSFYGSSYGGIGTWNGAVENDINYIVGSTGTSATGSATTYHGSGSSLSALYIPSTNWFIYSTRIRIPTLNDGSQKFYVNIGVNTTVPAATPPEGVGFLYDLDGTTTGSSASANWQTYSINGLNRTFNQNHTGVSVSANTWIKLKILFNSSTAYYYVDDVLIATHTTNMPSGDNIAPCSGIIKTAGTTARTYHMDYNTIDIKYSTPR